MYILVNKDNIIVGSCNNKPSEESCSANGQRVFEIANSEYTPEILGSSLLKYDIVKDNSDKK